MTLQLISSRTTLFIGRHIFNVAEASLCGHPLGFKLEANNCEVIIDHSLSDFLYFKTAP